MANMMTKTQAQILQLLMEKQEEPHSIRQLARELKKSYTLTYNNIQNLLEKGIISKQKVPPAQIIQLNAPANILIQIEQKRTEQFLEKHKWINLYLKDVLNAAKNPFFIILAFGSYAKGTETKNSDLDMLIIVPKKEDIKTLEQAAQQYTKIKKGIIVVDTQNFTEMINNPKTLNIGNEARKHHIILYGAEQYCQIIN